MRDKAEILIRHEAKQLAQIELELKARRRSFFVTADRGLREVLGVTRLGSVWNVVISHLGLIQLIDLLSGLQTEPRSLARLLWGVRAVDEKASLRDYFADRALKERDSLLFSRTLPQILDDFVRETEKSAKLEGIHFLSKNVEDKAKAARFLDRFEDRFFEKMREAIEKYERGRAQ